jgi:hypothetical protein
MYLIPVYDLADKYRYLPPDGTYALVASPADAGAVAAGRHSPRGLDRVDSSQAPGHRLRDAESESGQAR